MMNLYYIVNWPYHEHWRMPRYCLWVKAKVDFSGIDNIRIGCHPDAAAIDSAWTAARGLALLSPYRGLLLADGHNQTPLTEEMIASIVHRPVEVIRKGLAALVNDIGWIGVADDTLDYGALSIELWGRAFTDATVATSPKNKKPKRKTERPKAEKPAPEPPPQVPAELAELELYATDAKLHKGWDAFVASCKLAYPGVDIMAEIRKAHAWELTHPTQRKVMRQKFLNSWFSRTQDRGVPVGRVPAQTQAQPAHKPVPAPTTHLTDSDIQHQAEAYLAFLEKPGASDRKFAQAKGLTLYEVQLVRERAGMIRYLRRHPELDQTEVLSLWAGA